MVSFLKSKITLALGFIIVIVVIYSWGTEKESKSEELTVTVERKSFPIEVKTVGELEAAHSTTISSQIRGDQGKIIYLVEDGVNVKVGDILIKMDTTPFEERLETIQGKIREQQASLATIEKVVEWEISQCERENKTSQFEVEAAELELNKIVQGDGPLEMARHRASMQKALAKYEEVKGYTSDLLALEKEGFLNTAEIKNSEKKLEEERENFEAAKLQFESYSNHVFPMMVKKAEAAVKQAKSKREQNLKIQNHAVAKAKVELEQGQRILEVLKLQHKDALKELSLTEIPATAPGMVILREDFRNGQRRKPRLGDVLVKNQVIIDLPDLNIMTVKSKVREVDLYKVKVGKKALIEIDAYPQLAFTGTITLIGVLALPDPGRPTDEKYFEIRILLDKSHPNLRPGMTTRVIVQADKVENALAIPVHVLSYDQKITHCYVVKPDGYEKREVSTGLSNEEWIEIKSGLEEGEKVCLVAPTNLQL